jgi:hypothetical protein
MAWSESRQFKRYWQLIALDPDLGARWEERPMILAFLTSPLNLNANVATSRANLRQDLHILQGRKICENRKATSNLRRHPLRTQKICFRRGPHARHAEISRFDKEVRSTVNEPGRSPPRALVSTMQRLQYFCHKFIILDFLPRSWILL